MSKMRYVNTKFWDDGFITELEPDEKLLFLYFITNPLTDICGGYEIGIRRMVNDTGIENNKILEILEKFQKSGKVYYCEGWIFIQNFIKNQSINPKILAGIERSLKHCPNWIKDRVSIENNLLPIGNDISNSNSKLNINSHSQPISLQTKNHNEKGIGYKNSVSVQGKSKFSEEERRKYANSQPGIISPEGFVISSESGRFDHSIEAVLLQNEIKKCDGCKRHQQYEHIPPCPKHKSGEFDSWKSKFLERKKRECITCQNFVRNNDEVSKCEKHDSDEFFNQWLVKGLKGVRLNPSEYTEYISQDK